MLLVSDREYLVFFHLYAFFCAPPGTPVVGFIWTGNWNAQTSEKLVWNCLLLPAKQDICLEVVFPRALLQIANLFLALNHIQLQGTSVCNFWTCFGIMADECAYFICIWKASAGSGALDPRILLIGHGVLNQTNTHVLKSSVNSFRSAFGFVKAFQTCFTFKFNYLYNYYQLLSSVYSIVSCDNSLLRYSSKL